MYIYPIRQYGQMRTRRVEPVVATTGENMGNCKREFYQGDSRKYNSKGKLDKSEKGRLVDILVE